MAPSLSAKGWASGSSAPFCIVFPLVGPPRHFSRQLAVGPDKMHGSLSQETGMAGSSSSLLAVFSEGQTCVVFFFFLFCQMWADYFLLSLPVSTGNPSIPCTIYCHTPPHSLVVDPPSLNEAAPSLCTKCTGAPGLRVCPSARAEMLKYSFGSPAAPARFPG